VSNRQGIARDHKLKLFRIPFLGLLVIIGCYPAKKAFAAKVAVDQTLYLTEVRLDAIRTRSDTQHQRPQDVIGIIETRVLLEHLFSVFTQDSPDVIEGRSSLGLLVPAPVDQDSEDEVPLGVDCGALQLEDHRLAD